MPDDREKTTHEGASDRNDQPTLAVAGVLFVGPMASGRDGKSGGKSGVWVGPAAGWRAPRGIHQWEREISFIARASVTSALGTTLRATLPMEQIATKRFPMAAKAVETAPVLALSSNLVQAAQEQGIRVHTIGVDRVSGDFFYFEEGGSRPAVRAQGSLVDMLAPSLKPGTTNDEIAVLMDGILDRLLLALSEGEVSELDVELADALPRLSRDGTGLAGTDLEAFEAEATALAARAATFEAAARELPDTLSAASRRGKTTSAVPLFGEATKETKPALDLLLGGKPLQLSPQPIWTVRGAPRLEEKPVAKPVASPKPARVKAKATPAAAAKKSDPKPIEPKPAEAKPADPKPAAAKRAQSPSPGRVAPRIDTNPPPPVRPRVKSSVDTMPPPSPVLSPLSDRPGRPSPTPPSPRAGTKPTPLRTPVPAKPAEAAVAAAPVSAPALAPTSEPAPSAPASEPAVAPAPAPSEGRQKAAKTEPRAPLPIVPNVAASRVPAKRSPATLVVVVFAILAIAYVALRSFH
jgi:cell division septation protein DedD